MPNTRNTLSVHISRTENLNHFGKIKKSIKEGVCAVPCVGAVQLFFSVISLCHALSYPYQWHFVVKHSFKLCLLFFFFFFRQKCRPEEYICVCDLVEAREEAGIEISLSGNQWFFLQKCILNALES